MIARMAIFKSIANIPRHIWMALIRNYPFKCSCVTVAVKHINFSIVFLCILVRSNQQPSQMIIYRIQINIKIEYLKNYSNLRPILHSFCESCLFVTCVVLVFIHRNMTSSRCLILCYSFASLCIFWWRRFSYYHFRYCSSSSNLSSSSSQRSL